ncbi:MAG: hypothetical protein R2680_05110 [Nitrososphaeraceae archaeon]
MKRNQSTKENEYKDEKKSKTTREMSIKDEKKSKYNKGNEYKG